MKTEVFVVRADRDPMPGLKDLQPNQIYKHPRFSQEVRELGAVHPDEMRVQMLYAGVCGSDLHLIQMDPHTGYIKSSAPMRIPPEGRVIGHEGVGRVLEVGSHVRHAKPGDVVTFESIIVCHYCDVCRKGHFNQCRRARLLGLEKDGLFGTVVDVPSMLSHDVTDLAGCDEDLQAAACIEPAGVAYVACQNTRVSGGNRVVIFGGGPIGLYSGMLCDHVFGASEIHLVEPEPFRRELARKWFRYVYDVDEFFAQMPRQVDVVIETSGAMSNVANIFRGMNANSRIALLARSGQALHLDGIDHMITNEIELIGSRGHLCGAFSDIMSLYKNGRIPLRELITQVVNGLDGLEELLQHPEKVMTENCKVLVKFKE